MVLSGHWSSSSSVVCGGLVWTLLVFMLYLCDLFSSVWPTTCRSKRLSGLLLLLQWTGGCHFLLLCDLLSPVWQLIIFLFSLCDLFSPLIVTSSCCVTFGAGYVPGDVLYVGGRGMLCSSSSSSSIFC